MRFSSSTVTSFCLAAASVALSTNVASAFTPSRSFVGGKTGVSFVSQSAGTGTMASNHKAGCGCSACSVGLHKIGCGCPSCAVHPSSCACNSCGGTRLYMADGEGEDAGEDAVESVPAEVEAMDGIESSDEAHNEERKDNRGSLKKHKRAPKGTAIAELEVGSTVPGKVKSIASYGAFVDIGASTDGLLHISRLSNEFVADVNEILKVGQEIEVRIAAVDEGKNQVALSMITEEEEKANNAPRERAPRQSRNDDSPTMGALDAKGFDVNAFVEGEVVSTVDFGCFVRVDASTLNKEVEGSFDGLVHISSLAAGRTNNVSDVVKVGQKVQVRVKQIQGSKASLSMIKEEEEQQRGGRGNAEPVFEGAKDWKESLEKIGADMPTFVNTPIVMDKRS